MPDILASVSVVLGAEISGFKAAMAQARKDLSGLVKFSEGLKDVGESLTKYVSLPVAALGAASLKVGSDFQAAFNRVQAATQASGSELQALRQKAQGIALDPNLQFSSEQAAQALENLAKNGASTADILGGAADATTALATATGAQLATAADITTDVMNNFGKSASQAASLVSNITGATIASKFGIDDYRLALGQAGAVASQLGVSFEDFNTALSVTSSGFSSGSDAGTSFKTFLQRLVPQSKEAEAAIRKLGLNFFDAQGKMRPLRDIAGQLQQAFKGLSDQQKNTLGTQIFGADSLRTALLLAKEGAAGFDKMAESIGKVNAASQGAILNQGLTGGLEAFKSSLEGLGQAIADSGLLDFADKVVRQGASLASSLAQLNPELLGLGTVLAGLAAATGPAAIALGTLGAALPSIKAGFAAAKSSVALLGQGLAALISPTGLVIAGLAVLAGGIYYAATASDRALSSYREQAKEADRLSAATQPLVARYQELTEKTNRTEAEQRELTEVIKQLAKEVPGAITEIDRYGQVVGISAERVTALTTALQQQKTALAAQNLPDAQQKLQRLKTTYDALQKAMDQFNRTGTITQAGPSLGPGGGSVVATYKASAEAVAELRTQLANANVAFQEQTQLVAKLTSDAQGLGAIRASIAPLGDLYYKLGGGLDAAGKGSGELKKVSDATDELAKAYAEVQKSFRLIGNESIALGDQFNYLEARRDADLAGIKTLLSAGYSPLSQKVKELVADYKNLNNTLADNSLLMLRPLKGLPEVKTPDFELQLPRKRELDEETVLPNYEAMFRTAAQQVAAGGGALRAAYVPVTQAQLDFNTNMEALTEQLGSSIAPLLGEITSQFATAFGNLVTGTASAGDAMAQLFGGVLQALASFMADFGKKLIAIGIGKLSLDTLFNGPQGGPLAIAAGVGLLALSSVASAIGQSASASINKIGSGGANTGVSAAAPRTYTPATPPVATSTTITHKVIMTANGSTLAGVIEIAEKQRGRVTGKRN